MENVRTIVIGEAANFLSRHFVHVMAGAGPLPAGTVLAKFSEVGYSKFWPALDQPYSVEWAGVDKPVAVLLHGVDATDEDAPATVLMGPATIHASSLIFEASINDEEKIQRKLAQLEAAGIVCQ